jgi:hypothetical protein
MTYRRIFIGTFQGDRDWAEEVRFFKEIIVPAMKTRGATSTEMIQGGNNTFVATATYSDQETADADPEGIQSLRKSIIEAFNLNRMDAFGGTTVVGF